MAVTSSPRVPPAEYLAARSSAALPRRRPETPSVAPSSARALGQCEDLSEHGEVHRRGSPRERAFYRAARVGSGQGARSSQ